MKYINIYQKQSARLEPKPIPKASYQTGEFIKYDLENSPIVEIRAYKTGRTVKNYSKDKYFYLREDFNAVEEPNKIKPFTDEPEPKILNAAIDEPKQEITEPKTSKSKLKSNKKYLDKQAEIKLRMTPDLKKQIQDHCDKLGVSTNKFIIDLIKDNLENDPMHK